MVERGRGTGRAGGRNIRGEEAVEEGKREMWG